VGAALLLLGLLALQGQLATSSLPPPEVGPSGLLLHPASADQTDVLSAGLRPGVRIEAVSAIESTRHERAWYVGARVRGLGPSTQVAVWLVTGPKAHPDLLYSVGRAARAASVWPAGGEGGASVSPADPEALALFSALKARR
jgi:hypothetical protein